MATSTAICGVRVQQAWARSTGRCSHLVSCLRTGAAAVVDPHPETREELEDWASQPGVKLRYQLYTRVWEEPARRSRLSELQSRLGLSGRVEPDAGPQRWEPPVRARVAPAPGDHPTTTFVRLGECVLALPADPSGSLRRFTLVSTPPSVPMMQVASLRIALGAFHIQVVPIPGHPRLLAYEISDRVLFGGSLRTALHQDPPDVMPVELPFPDDALVYPAVSCGGVTVATMGTERALATHRGVRHVDAGSLADEGLEALAGLVLGAPDGSLAG